MTHDAKERDECILGWRTFLTNIYWGLKLLNCTAFHVLCNLFCDQAKRKVVLETLGAFSCTCICLSAEPSANTSFSSCAYVELFKGNKVSYCIWVFIWFVFHCEIYRCTEDS